MFLAHQRWKSPTSANATKIVLLHGMGGTGALWRPVGATLEDHYDLLAVDQRGHGGSQTPQASYSPLDFGQDVIETMESLEFHPAWIIGHSMGARTAAAAAHLKPSWFKGLVLVDLGFAGPAGGGLGDNLAHFLRILPEGFPSRAEARTFMNDHCPDPSMAQYLMAVSVSKPDGSITFPFDHPALIQTLEAVRDSSIRDWLRELAQAGMPVLALRGGTSTVWSKADFEKEKAAFGDLPQMQFKEVEGTGHGLPFEKRAEFLSIVQAFFKEKKLAP